MKFSQIEFRQKLLNNRVKRLFEAIEPDLNSFSRLMDLFLTAGGELRESSLGTISRAVNEKKVFEIRQIRMEIVAEQEKIQEQDRTIEDTWPTKPDPNADPKGYASFMSAKKQLDDLKRAKQDLATQKDKLQSDLYSQAAQNTIFRAAFARLEQCAEEMGLPTAKNGFAGATFASKIPTVASATSPAPIVGTGKYKPQPAPRAPWASVIPPATTNQKPAMLPASGQAASGSTSNGNKAANAAAKAKAKAQGQANPAVTPPPPPPPPPPPQDQAQPNASSRPTQAPPVQPAAQKPLVKPWVKIQEFGSRLETQEAKGFLGAMVTWLNSAKLPKSDQVIWLSQEYEKYILDEAEKCLGRADAAFAKPEYKSELSPELFNPAVFKKPAERMVVSTANDKKLVAMGKGKFGQVDLDLETMRFRDYFDTKIWPVISSEMVRLAQESTITFRTQDVQSIVETIKNLEASGTDLNAGLASIAEGLNVPVEDVAAAASIVVNSFDPASVPEQEPGQEPAVPGQEPVQGSVGAPTQVSSGPVSTEDYLNITKELMNLTGGGKKPLGGEDLRKFFKPFIDKNVGTLGKENPDAILGKIYDNFDQAKKQTRLNPGLGLKPEQVDFAKEQFGDVNSYDHAWALAAVQNAPEPGTTPQVTPEVTPEVTALADEPLGDKVPGQEPLVPQEEPSAPGQEPVPVQGRELVPEDFEQFVQNSGQEFVSSKNLEIMRPLIKLAVSARSEFNQDTPLNVLNVLTTAFTFYGMKNRQLKPLVRGIGKVLAEKREDFLQIVSQEIQNKTSGTSQIQEPAGQKPLPEIPGQEPVVETPPGPVETSSGTLDISASVARARQALAALETADLNQLAKISKKTPQQVIEEITELRAILKKEGLNAVLIAASKYLGK
jgi:predicted transcriptional regulator